MSANFKHLKQAKPLIAAFGFTKASYALILAELWTASEGEF